MESTQYFCEKGKYLLNATKRKCLFLRQKRSDEIDLEGYSRMCLGTFITCVCVSRKDSSTKKLFNKSARKQKQVPLKT